MVPEAGAFFGRRMTSNIIFREGYKRSGTPNVLRSIAVSLQPGCFEEAVKVRRLAAMKAAGVNGCQGTPRSEELDVKKLHGAAGGEYDREPRESAISCTQPFPASTMWYYVGLQGDGVFLHDFLFLYSRTKLEQYLTSSLSFPSRPVLLYKRKNRVTLERKLHLSTRT